MSEWMNIKEKKKADHAKKTLYLVNKIMEWWMDSLWSVSVLPPLDSRRLYWIQTKWTRPASDGVQLLLKLHKMIREVKINKKLDVSGWDESDY